VEPLPDVRGQGLVEEQVRPGEEVAVMTYGSYSGVGIHENLTTDHDRVRDAVGRLADIPGYGSGGGFSLPGEGMPGEAAGGTDAPAGVEELAPGYEMDWEHLKERTIDFALAMQDLAKALRFVPGFKNIVLYCLAEKVLNYVCIALKES